MRVDREVMNVLSNARVDGAALFLVGQLDRKLYERTNRVLEASGGKWNRSKKAHIFDGDASDRIEQIILTGDIAIPKDEFNFFPSPPAIVARLLDLANIERGMRVLEPSAGKGAIAYACAEKGALVDCYELMEANFVALAGDARLGPVKHADFLSQVPEPVYDRIVMNPPFLRQADIKHVQHALNFLKPGGRLVSVMAASVSFRENRLTSDFRALVAKRGGHIEDCPDGSFKASGTMVSTVIAVIPA